LSINTLALKVLVVFLGRRKNEFNCEGLASIDGKMREVRSVMVWISETH